MVCIYISRSYTCSLTVPVLDSALKTLLSLALRGRRRNSDYAFPRLSEIYTATWIARVFFGFSWTQLFGSSMGPDWAGLGDLLRACINFEV